VAGSPTLLVQSMLMMEPQTTPYPRWLQRLVELLIVILFVTWVFLGVVLFVEVSFAQAAIGFVVVSIFWGLVGAELAAALKKVVAADFEHWWNVYTRV
jgi:hypothetical protein